MDGHISVHVLLALRSGKLGFLSEVTLIRIIIVIINSDKILCAYRILYYLLVSQ